jgi:hypothetical protein
LPPKAISALIRYAKCKMWGIKATVTTSDAEDLLHEAIQKTLDGGRKWKADERDLENHLKQCMSSIANGWYKRGRRTTQLPEHLPQHLETPARQHDEAEARQKIDTIRQALRGDVVALSVLESMLYEESRKDALRRLHISEAVYAAAKKRISYYAEIMISSTWGKKHA